MCCGMRVAVEMKMLLVCINNIGVTSHHPHGWYESESTYEYLLSIVPPRL